MKDGPSLEHNSHKLTAEDQCTCTTLVNHIHVESLAGNDGENRTSIVREDGSVTSVYSPVSGVSEGDSVSLRNAGVVVNSSGADGGRMDDGITEEERETVMIGCLH